MPNYSSITFRGAAGDRSTVRIAEVSTSAALTTFAGVLKGYSNAVWTEHRMATENASPGSAVEAQYAECQSKAIIIMRDTGEDSIVKISVPAVKASMIVIVNKKRVVDQTQGATLAAALATATGKTLTYESGKLWSRPTKT